MSGKHRYQPVRDLAAEAIEQADLAWHLRAWGRRVLSQARQALAARYPTYAEFEPLRRKGRKRTGVTA